MNLYPVLQKAWQMLWHYRALWLFGAILALVGPNIITPGPWLGNEDSDEWTRIKLSDQLTYQMPGVDMTIDLSAPEGRRIILPGDGSWRDVDQLVDVIEDELRIKLRPILIELVMILAISLLVGKVVRYITETALIRMVNETEETGRYVRIRDGLRKGFSSGAWRLFLLDLLVSVLLAVVFAILFGIAMIPILLALRSNEVVLITAGTGTTVLLVLAIFVWLVLRVVLSLVIQTIRRACVLEKQGLIASIRMGSRITRRHLGVVAPLWLIWVSIQLAWIPFGALVLLLLSPFLLLTTPIGVVLGGIPAALIAAITGVFMDGATPWIMGALAGLPILIIVMISPILFVSGLVEVFLSSTWTLTYGELRKINPAPAIQTPPGPADQAADQELDLDG